MQEDLKGNSEDYSCFGEYSPCEKCRRCFQRLSCENFTKEKRESIYRKEHRKYKGRGKWTRKDLY